MIMKKLIRAILLVILMITVSGSTAFAATGLGIEPGEAIPDFTVSLTDGTTATLSEVLKEKDLVVLNIFASWCSPCEREFPEMNAVYQAHKDRMEIIAVSGDSGDTMEVMSDYKAGHSLSFPVGLAGDSLDFIDHSTFPTTVFIDRGSKAGFIKVGAFASREDFENKVNFFLSPDYDGKPLNTEKAVSLLPYLLGWGVIGGLLTLIGRWGILRKAGKKGWHSLIPFLNTYQEYSTCWIGWIGLLADLLAVLSLASNMNGLPSIVYWVLVVLKYAITIPESLKLAKAFGKGKVFGVLLALPVFKQLCRFILGVGKAKYQYPGSGTYEA